MNERWEVLDMEVGKVLYDAYHEGIRVLVMRGPSSLCAYCGVPSKHPLAGHSYNDLSIGVHGGLTFSREGKAGLVPIPNKWPEGFYWYGWDYAHSGDRCAYDYKYNRPLNPREKEWTVKEVVEEARWAAYDFAQLMKLAEVIATRALEWK